jgi:hypothetical protein
MAMAGFFRVFQRDARLSDGRAGAQQLNLLLDRIKRPSPSGKTLSLQVLSGVAIIGSL